MLKWTRHSGNIMPSSAPISNFTWRWAATTVAYPPKYQIIFIKNAIWIDWIDWMIAWIVKQLPYNCSVVNCIPSANILCIQSKLSILTNLCQEYISNCGVNISFVFYILTKFPKISFPHETAVIWNGKKPDLKAFQFITIIHYFGKLFITKN